LNWNTYYYWRANAKNALGSPSPWPTPYYFQTAIGPPPNPPYGLTANAISSSQIDLAWTDNSTDETGFKIERKTGASGTFALIATTGAGINTYSNNAGLSADTQYCYRVQAYNAAGNSTYSNEPCATTLPPPPPAPVLVSPTYGLTGVNTTPTLDWNPSTGATTYGVQLATDYAFTSPLVNTTGLTDTQYTVPGALLNWNTVYYWRANATNALGSPSPWSTLYYFQTAP
jgi:titin